MTCYESEAEFETGFSVSIITISKFRQLRGVTDKANHFVSRNRVHGHQKHVSALQLAKTKP